MNSDKENMLTSTANTTYMQCYGVKDSFSARSKLIKKSWALNDNRNYIKLGGYWHNGSFTSIKENYFVVQTIDGEAVAAEDVHDKLWQIASKTIEMEYSQDYAKNMVYFASGSSLGWEYPILSEIDEKEIYKGEDIFDYSKILRYAFASSYVYSLEEGAPPFPFSDDPIFKKLMLPEGETEPNVVDQVLGGENGVYAMAIKVPAVAEQSLEEEIIIAYKGTSNGGDVVQDIKLMFKNFFESDIDWEKDSYDFCKRVIDKYPPNNQSMEKGYQKPNGQYNVVITGHSLGGYTAINTGTITGILTRAFSSPATKIIEKYVKIFANTMRLNNSINFIRQYDPVATASGRHDENMTCYPYASKLKPWDNHFLSPFILNILEKLYENYRDEDAAPEEIYITPDATEGSGLQKRINYWGNMK